MTTHINDEFDFLGWNFKKYCVGKKTKMFIKPSKKSLKAIMDSVKDTVLGYGLAMTQDDIIKELNPKLLGWGSYHSSAVSKRTFYYLDTYVFEILYKWGLKRHNKKGKRWIADRYWHRRIVSNGHSAPIRIP